MQPYFLPYLGYFQLINIVDEFVIYDNIQYSRRGWINRNRIYSDLKDQYISLPLRKDSDYLDVNNRFLVERFDLEALKILRKIESVYKKAPFYDIVYPLIEDILLYKNLNLFDFVHNSIVKVCNYIEIETKLTVSSKIDIDHSLKAQSKVLAICEYLNADIYVNPIGGIELYSQKEFKNSGFDLKFLKSGQFKYSQFSDEFIPNLSILDVLMFNSIESVQDSLRKNYTLITN